MEFSPAEFSLSVFLEETIDLFCIRARGKGIAFTYHNRDRLPDRIYADDRQLRTILEHLLNHAMQMTQAGGLIFSVEVLGQSSSGSIATSDSQLRFQFEDTGCSLTATTLKLRILESQSDGRCPALPPIQVTPTPELDSIQQLMRPMGNKLHANNLPGVGSLVWMDMTFPSTYHVHPEKPTDLKSQNDRPSPLRILLAEDIPVNQKLALRILKRLGYKADLATNGIEVLDALGRQVYDVVFMDVQMPKMDGLEATRRIRQELPQDCHPWIIALTANTAIADRDACLAVGMNDYLSKPIDMGALERSLLQCPIACR